jgi:NAD(P)-dependent dehydrogenase (short-subunit alcohol dehydrogenase family)
MLQGDVAVKEDARCVVRQVVKTWGRLDILVNNAGITRDKSTRNMDDQEWADVINVNLNGTYYCTSAALPHMIEQKYGRIINITSCVGHAGGFGQPNYAASKGGIVAFTRSVAIEMAKYNITANAIAPGFTLTETLSPIPPELLEQIKSRIPLGRFGEPAEIARAAVFLAAEGDYITGQQLSVNGGMFMP